MRISAYTVRERFRRMDPVLLVCTLIPSVMSILTLWGCRDFYVGGMQRVFVQLAAILLGGAAAFVIANMDYEQLADRLFWFFFAISVVLLVLVLTPLGTGEGTNKSYIVIPFLPVNLQPSEFVKITFIITFAKHLSLARETINRPKTLIGVALHAGLIVGLVLLEKDLGMALVYIAFVAIMLFCAGLSLWYFLGMIVAAVLAFPYLWTKLASYQQERILYGFRPELDPLNKGMQPLKSKAAIAAGGLWGQGLENSSAYEAIPRKGAYTDFIFGIFGEMFGFVGCLLLIVVYAVLIIRILWIARHSRKDVGTLICIGIVGTMLVQVMENIGMCLAMLPVVGITLPFMSYGGSSMLAMYVLVGLAHSVRAQRNKYYFERENT